MKKTILALIILSLFSTVTHARGLKAQNPAVIAERFAQHKQKMLARIDEHRACVVNAQTIEQIKSCRSSKAQGHNALGTGNDN